MSSLAVGAKRIIQPAGPGQPDENLCAICKDDESTIPLKTVHSVQVRDPSNPRGYKLVAHQFHVDCFRSWVNARIYEVTCPICRKILTQEEVDRALREDVSSARVPAAVAHASHDVYDAGADDNSDNDVRLDTSEEAFSFHPGVLDNLSDDALEDQFNASFSSRHSFDSFDISRLATPQFLRRQRELERQFHETARRTADQRRIDQRQRQEAQELAQMTRDARARQEELVRTRGRAPHRNIKNHFHMLIQNIRNTVFEFFRTIYQFFRSPYPNMFFYFKVAAFILVSEVFMASFSPTLFLTELGSTLVSYAVMNLPLRSRKIQNLMNHHPLIELIVKITIPLVTLIGILVASPLIAEYSLSLITLEVSQALMIDYISLGAVWGYFLYYFRLSDN